MNATDLMQKKSPKRGLLLFVHGYLDSPLVWGPVIDALNPSDWTLATVAIQGASMPEASSAELLEHYASLVAEHAQCCAPADEIPIILVGHSMGGQIVELAGSVLRRRLAGLILVTPAPLAGYPLPPALMERFRSRAGLTDLEEIREGKRGLGISLSDQALDILAKSTAATSRETALEHLRAWTGGHVYGQGDSIIDTPVLIISTDDKFFTKKLIDEQSKRFRNFSVEKISEAGHWPHLEQAEKLSNSIRRFITSRR